ncbi:MAG TPA: hypothetical protein VLG40_00955 [Candidatus Saccharimonas sp.]|nr:hypothetical protein [Candidatus Saccharimonas sp.]
MIKRGLLALLTLVTLLCASTLPASAAVFGPAPPGTVDQGQGTLGVACNAQTGGSITFLELKPWDACLQHDGHGVPQITSLDDIWRVAVIVIETMIKIAAYLAVGFIIWGGIKYLKSQGDPGELNVARQIITNAVIGLVIAFVGVAMIQLVAGTF